MAGESPFNFSGQRALVTGASRGIGAVIATHLARAGAHVFTHYRQNEAGAQATAEAIRAAGGSATLVQANLVDVDAIGAMFGTVHATGPLDILIHNAAIGSFKPAMGVRANQWDLTMSVNARALLLCAQHAAPLMDGRGGKIVALSSAGSTRVIPNYGAIGFSKAALEAVVRTLAVELAPARIRVNAVTAGLIDTASIRLHPQYAEIEARARERTLAGRIGTPEDLARVVAFLCSPLADWIVGQTIVADGGAGLVV